MSETLSFLCLVAEIGSTRPSAHWLRMQASKKLGQKRGLAEASYADRSEMTRRQPASIQT